MDEWRCSSISSISQHWIEVIGQLQASAFLPPGKSSPIQVPPYIGRLCEIQRFYRCVCVRECVRMRTHTRVCVCIYICIYKDLYVCISPINTLRFSADGLLHISGG